MAGLPVPSDSLFLTGPMSLRPPKDWRAREVPPHRRDVAPHEHGVLDSHRVCLRVGTAVGGQGGLMVTSAPTVPRASATVCGVSRAGVCM